MREEPVAIRYFQRKMKKEGSIFWQPPVIVKEMCWAGLPFVPRMPRVRLGVTKTGQLRAEKILIKPTIRRDRQ